MNPFAPNAPTCPTCSGRAIRWGKDRQGNQRYKCKGCGTAFADIPVRPLGRMRLSIEKATLCVSLLTEGSSIRSTERVTGVHRDTICRLLRVVGDKCSDLLGRLVHAVPVKDVQCDEIWSFVSMKERTKTRKGIVSDEIGDAYTFLGIERGSKVILAHQVGRRTSENADIFAAKLATATTPANGENFQLSTDGWDGYPAAIEQHFGGTVDYGQIIKSFDGGGMDSDRRYSPPSIIAIEKRVITGTPDAAKICTSHVERLNLHVRMMGRRFTRLTTGFSRKHANLRAAVALFVASYNFTWMHSALRCTPAMAAGIARKPWSVRELVLAT
jgi:transposase-like protein/IS1 family transposase